MDTQKEVWVIGHKNPDTDSICSAIAYANLKNQCEDSDTVYCPKRAGELNQETRYVLTRFGAEEPGLAESAGTQLMDIDLRHTPGVSGHYSLKKAWELMKSLDVVTLPIVNENGYLDGVIVNGDIAYSYMDVYDNHILGRARTQYKNIVEALNGTVVAGNAHAYFVKGKVVVASGNREDIRREIEEDDLVILGNVKERQLIALEENPSCMIVSTDKDLDPEVVTRAKEIDCVLITTAYDSFTVARLIHQSMPIKYFMTRKNLIAFDLDDYVDDVKDAISKVRHRDFPVIDDDRKYVGMFSRRNLMDMQKKQLILVDHNEKTQAIDHIEEADILEIIDHHRLGSLETITPIFFRNQPLGCTATIIYQMYLEKGVEVTETIAGLLLSAILSDTLMFRSPTCTPVDRETAARLAQIASVDYEELALSMFEAGSDFGNKTAEEIFYQDFKTFKFEDTAFGIAQISAVSAKQLDEIKAPLAEFMNTVLIEKNLNYVFVMLTNILTEGSELLYAGAGAETFVAATFGSEAVADGICRLPGVVSRKKQLVPAIMEQFQQ